MSFKLTVGKCAIARKDLYTNEAIMAFNVNKGFILDSSFLYYYLQGYRWSGTNKAVMGLTLNKATISKQKIAIPPMAEQERIVERLDAAFAQIDELKSNAEKQLAEARALFQSALTQAMQPKPGWQEKTLKEIGLTQTGTTPSKSDKSNYGNFIPFIRPSEIDFDGCGGINYDCEMKLSEKGLSIGRLFKKHSVLMVCIGATISKVGFSTQDISCNQQINVLYPCDKYHYKYIYYAMRNDDFKRKVIKEGTSAQATLPIINKSKWENLTLFVPDIEEQQRISNYLDSLASSVRELEEISRKTAAECDALKQALLRQIFE
jgi:type I restriction enzyme S subunit